MALQRVYTSKHGIAADLSNFTVIIHVSFIDLHFDMRISAHMSTDSGYAAAIVTATAVYMVFYFIALIWIFFADYI